MKEELNLFDFGNNERGEYVNLVEEEKQKNDIEEKDFNSWLETQGNPLVNLAYDFLISSIKLEKYTFNEIKEELEWIAGQKIYHYGNMKLDFYIYTLFEGDCWCFVFETPKYIMANLNYMYSQKEVEEHLTGKKLIQFNALSVRVYDTKGKRITEYGDRESDIRYKAVIQEWQMNKYGQNRMNKGKKIKDFYEVELSLPKLIDFYGEEKPNER